MKETQENLKQKRMKQRGKVENLQRNKKEHGITLIALVVTIVVLLILAGITINMLFSNGGIFKVAQDAANAWNQAVINEQADLDNLTEQIQNLVNGQIGGGTGTGGGDEEPVDIITVTEIVQKEEGQKAKDTYGNVVVVPKGFKVVVSEGTTVPEGIVIEDGTGTETTTGNQFVWIPVGTVHKDSNPTNDVTIKLGRYTFDKTNGTPTMQQAAFAGDNPNSPSQTYASDPPVTIKSYYQELTTYREGVASDGTNGLNATAKNLKAFVESVANNGGYYIARYEASYGSGYNSAGSTDEEKYANAKPLSKASTTNSTSSMTYDDDNPGQLWDFITQLNASKVSQNMYANDDNTVGVESDLINSYAWDTAIVFIQSMNEANSNYANARRDETGNSSLMNTGTTGDEVCNIFDMAANISEWTTEYSTRMGSSNASPCTFRGGNFNTSIYYTAGRDYSYATTSSTYIGFRVSLYIK